MDNETDLRTQIALMMENNKILTKLQGKDWHDIEDAICNIFFETLGVSETERLFSQCDKAPIVIQTNIYLDDHPTPFEEKIYRKVDRYYHKQDILGVIYDDQEQRNWEGVPRLVYQTHDLDKLVNDYENNLTGDLQLARDVLKNYQDSHIFEEIV